MSLLEILSRICVAFVAGTGLLFGQVYFGRFELLPTIMGLAGLGVVFLAGNMARKATVWAILTIALGVVALIGVGADAFSYYGNDPHPGSYYPWVLMAPFAISLITLVWLTITEFSPEQSVEPVRRG